MPPTAPQGETGRRAPQQRGKSLTSCASLATPTQRLPPYRHGDGTHAPSGATGHLRADAAWRPLSTRCQPRPCVLPQRRSTWLQSLKPLLLTLMTFDPPPVFLYNAPRTQGGSPTRLSATAFYPHGFAPWIKRSSFGFLFPNHVRRQLVEHRECIV